MYIRKKMIFALARQQSYTGLPERVMVVLSKFPEWNMWKCARSPTVGMIVFVSI